MKDFMRRLLFGDTRQNACHVCIRMDSAGRGSVFVDGRKVEQVRRVQFEAGVGEANVIRIEIIAPRVSIYGPAEVRMETR